ncbi:phosphatidylserine decarboxylase [Nocardioides sp. LS1]|uniref:phosphatidylserine decarboxylase n=1 Tax=Nocardioides sp. LS1 TaxID=1027620 RepID=UPI000FFA290F|nr:phosphatidylserine decarboxylase [Nocardioides sp. LS1]GCD88864.1 phosphatidylserine decarboxylase proenzyme [Nocardioides sp. LS1]
MSLRPARGTPWWIALTWAPALIVPRLPFRLVLTAAAAATTSFFRDPERRPAGPGLVAAADGKIREVVQREDGRWFVSTYLALYNVHVSRMPCDATVLEQDHIEGDHRLAFADDAHTNERMEWLLDTAYGELEMTQFSGAAARRIIPYVGPGAVLRRGDRIGLIRFGSRVDLLLPVGLVPTVREGQRVRGAQDVVAVAETAEPTR